MSNGSPNQALREPLTLAALSPLLLSYHVQAALVILPNTFIFKLLLLPYILWQAWKCIVEFDHAALFAESFGHHGTDRVAFCSFVYVVRYFSKWMSPRWMFAEVRYPQIAIFCIGLRASEWTFVKRPLRRYEQPKHNQDTPIERPLSVFSVFVDTFDLLSNTRGIGWSWSSKPFPHESTQPPSIASVLFKTLLNLTVFDGSQYIIQYLFPSTNHPKGGSIFDPNLTLVPRTALAALCGICGGVWAYALVDFVYHVSTLVGRTVLGQPASVWPPAFQRPWMSTSIEEFWSVRWHQFPRHVFIVFGARPGGKLFGRPGAVMGAFAVSALAHHIGLWAVGNGTEFATAGGFFLLMGVGGLIEGAFTGATGLKVRGWLGWLWTMIWTTLWGTFMIDGWARHGLLATDFLPNGFRPGKVVVDAIIVLSSQ